MSTKLLPYVNSKTVSSIPDTQILEASSVIYDYSNVPNILLPGYDIKNWFDNHSQGDSIILIDAGNYRYIDAYKDNTSQMHINIHYNNVLIGSFFQNVGEYPWIYLGVGVDDANQLGYAVVLYRQGDDSNTKLRAYGICQSTSAQGNLYSLLRGAVPIPSNLSGGAGSGYIGNSLLSNKKMVGYNVPTSSAESTKTESVNEASENPVSGKPKIGNGFARIKFLRDVSRVTFESLLKGSITDYISYNSGGSAPRNVIPDYFNDYLLSDKSLLWGWTQRRPLTYNDPYYSFASRSNESTSSFAIPIQRKTLSKLNLKLGLFNQPTQWCTGNIFAISIKNGVQTVEALISFGRNQYTYNIPELNTYYDFSWEGLKEDVDYIVFNGEDGEWRFKDIFLFVN